MFCSVLFLVKDEISDSPQHQKLNQSLPATPKSVSETPNSIGPIDSETGDTADNGEDYNGEYDDSDDQRKFVLAPTPAQRGLAPLQRRLGSLAGNDSNSKSENRNIFNFFRKIL